MEMAAPAPASATSPWGSSSGGLGVPPSSRVAPLDPTEDRVSPLRLFAGTAGFAILALYAAVMIAFGGPRGYFTSILFSFVHALGLGLAALGLLGLRSAPASIAAATNGVAGLLMLSLPLLRVVEIGSLTVLQLAFVVVNGAITLAAVMNAAAAYGNAAKLGPIRLIVAFLWSLAAIPAARFVYSATMILLRDPLNPADDALWSQLYFSFSGVAAAATAVAFVLAKVKSDTADAA